LGRGDTNSFAPLQDDNDNEVVDNDKTMKDATKKSGGGTAMKDTTKKSGGSATTELPFFDRYRARSKGVATDDSMGRKPESSSNSPIPSVFAKSAGTPGIVSFAISKGRNETELNNLKPTAKEKTGDVDVSGSLVAKTGGGNQKKDGRVINRSNTSRRNNINTENVGDLPTQSTPSITTPRISISSSYAAAAAGKKPISQDKELQGFTVVVTIIVKVNKGEEPKKKFTDKIVKGLTFLHGEGEDPQVAVLLINHAGVVTKNTKRIKNKSDLPTSIMGLRKYFSVTSSMAFNKVNNSTGRSVKCYARIFCSSDPKQLLNEAGADLRNLGVGDLPQRTSSGRNSIKPSAIRSTYDD
jgi:hypothetical protein